MNQVKKSKYEIDMCSGSIVMKMLLFALPLMLSSVLQLLFNAADIVVVGRFAGDNSLAAVGATGSVINLLTNLFIGLSIGTNVLVARYYGAREDKELSRTVHTSILLSVFSGVFLTIVGFVGARQILEWMQTPKEVLDLAVTYLRIYFLGMTAMMVYNFGSAILRAVGDTRRPLVFLLIAGVLNVLLNLFFVIVLRMAVAGVAAATALSQCVSAFLVIRCLLKEQGGIQLIPKRLKIDREKMIRILKIGLPAGFQGIVFSLSNVVIQSSINLFGPAVVAGNSAAANVEGFVYVGMNAFYQATISFTSQNVGAGKKERINRIVLTGEICAILVGTILGNLVDYFGRDLLTIYSSSKQVIVAGMHRFDVVARLYALCGMMDVMVGALRGLGYSVLPMIISLVGACGLRLLWIATVFQWDSFHTVTTIYASYPITWGLTFVAHIICFVVIRRRMNQQYLLYK